MVLLRKTITMASKREHVHFPGSTGVQLAGKVELPAGAIRGTAVFAHCFTCSADSVAAARISVGLANAGIAVMRFDFTGLGASSGDFADTNFSTNVADIAAASRFLSEHYRAPGLLIGHSLGGAAVLAAASELPSVRAVVTVAAPSQPNHVLALLADDLTQLETDGEATVDLGGRPFRLKQQLIDDLRDQRLERNVANLDAALLVMHSPIDSTVGIENAGEIYAAARHPKSFISLDGADHLLTNRRDATFAAVMISSWVERYLDPDVHADTPASLLGTVVSETGEGRFVNQVIAGNNRFLMDEPESVGGSGAGPNPYDLLAAALGGCTSMTLRMYADRKNIPLEHVSVEVRHSREHCDDCAASAEGRTPKVDRWERRLRLSGDLSDADRSALARIADRCPVHRTLERSSDVVTELVGDSVDDLDT